MVVVSTGCAIAVDHAFNIIQSVDSSEKILQTEPHIILMVI